jgi:hypothetical protein
MHFTYSARDYIWILEHFQNQYIKLEKIREEKIEAGSSNIIHKLWQSQMYC